MMRIGIVGFGRIGRQVASLLHSDGTSGGRVAIVSGRDLGKAKAAVDELGIPCDVGTFHEVLEACDLIVESSTPQAVPSIVPAALDAGLQVVAISTAGLLDCDDLEKRARRGGGRLLVANGVLPGMDIIRSIRELGIDRVTLYSHLPSATLVAEPYVRASGIEIGGSTEPVLLFSGSSAEAGRLFPRHLNIAVTLGLAGIGVDATQVELWCDPSLTGFSHRVELISRDLCLSMTAQHNPPNPSEVNRSRIVAGSVVAAIRGLEVPFRIGG